MRHPKGRNWRNGPHVKMCRSCYCKNRAWVLKDQNPGERRCPYCRGQRWEPLVDVVGKNWEEPYRTMIETVGPSSSPKKRPETTHLTRLVEASEPTITAEAAS